MPDQPTNPHQNIIVEDESLRQGFTQIPNALLRRTDLTPGGKLTYMGLLSYAWQRDSCFPGQDTLARDIGVGKRSVIRYLQELEEVGLLEIRRRGLGQTNLYILKRFIDTSRSANLAFQEVPNSTHPEVQNWHTKNTQLEKDSERKTSNIRKVKTSDFEGETPESRAPRTLTEAVQQRRATPAPARSGGVRSVGEELQRRRPTKPTTDRESRQAVQHFISDFARELGDEAPIKSSVTRAVNLLQEAGGNLDRFIDAMYQAKAETQERTASIRKTSATGGSWARKNKMAYFFTVLEDKLGLKEPASQG